ncbi:MAG: peroxiredoxin [Candidatus Poseidoniales archaeon]
MDNSIFDEGWTIIFFYPKASSPGCTIQACEFRDLSDDFSNLDIPIFGVSSDIKRHQQRFKEGNNLSFSLLSDKELNLQKALGMKKSLGFLSGRVTFIIDDKGIIRDVFNSQLRFKQHARRALKKLKAR